MIISLFPDPAERMRAIGVYGFVASAGGSIGLLAGGVLTSALDWRWIFLVNLPVGVLTCLGTLRYVDAGRSPAAGRRADTLSAVLLTLGVMAGVYTIVEVLQRGTGTTAATGGAACALLVAFVVRQARSTEPLLPLRLFRSRIVTGANLVQGLLVVGMFGTFFLGALHLQEIRGYGPLQIGLAFLPATVVMGVMSLRLAAGVTRRLGEQRTLVLSLLVLTGGLLLMTRLPVSGTYLVDIAPAMVLTGLGAGLGFPALTGWRSRRRRRSTPGSPRVSTTPPCRSAARSGWPCCRPWPPAGPITSPSGAGRAEALTGGYHLAFWGAALAAALAALLATAMFRPTRPVRVEDSTAAQEPEGLAPEGLATAGHQA